MTFNDTDIVAHTINCGLTRDCTCALLNKVNNARYLGLQIDKNWKFYDHIDNLILKLRRVIPTFYKIRNLLNVNNKKLIFEAMVMSLTRYANTIYGSTSVNLIARVQKVINKAIKVLFNNDRTKKRTQLLYEELKIMNVKQSIIYTNLTQNYFKTDFKIKKSRNVRKDNNWLVEPMWRNSYGKRGMAFQIPHQFNKLPTELRNLTSIYKVRKEIKKWLIN
jgi:hypothetical protein